MGLKVVRGGYVSGKVAARSGGGRRNRPGGVGGEAARGEMVETDAVLEGADGVLDLGVAAMVGFQFQGVPVPVGDEGMIAVVGEEGQLRARRWLDRRTMSRTGAASGSLWKGV